MERKEIRAILISTAPLGLFHHTNIVITVQFAQANLLYFTFSRLNVKFVFIKILPFVPNMVIFKTYPTMVLCQATEPENFLHATGNFLANCKKIKHIQMV